VLSKTTEKSKEGIKVCIAKIAVEEVMSSIHTCLASVRPRFQTSVLPKKKKNTSLCLLLGINERTHYQETQLNEVRVWHGRRWGKGLLFVIINTSAL
jgi:hypothetical protein